MLYQGSLLHLETSCRIFFASADQLSYSIAFRDQLSYTVAYGDQLSYSVTSGDS